MSTKDKWGQRDAPMPGDPHYAEYYGHPTLQNKSACDGGTYAHTRSLVEVKAGYCDTCAPKQCRDIPGWLLFWQWESHDEITIIGFKLIDEDTVDLLSCQKSGLIDCYSDNQVEGCLRDFAQNPHKFR